MNEVAVLIISLGIILIGAEVFVNGVEWLGKVFNLSEGAVGSVLAAVGTALPETLIPIIAIVFGHGQHGHEIGIGAILGAPFMLSTLAMFVTGVAVFAFSRRRRTGSKVVVDYSNMSRDLGFFIIVYALAVLTGIIPAGFRTLKIIIACVLVIAYFSYVFLTVKQERSIESDQQLPCCYFARQQACPSSLIIILQVLVALGLIILGANLFVSAIEQVAAMYAVPAFILALIITPIATELPEKFNSVIWISRGKDTLALGNITGAMVFQSSLIPALGILLTDWQLNSSALLCALIAILSAAFIFWELQSKKHLTNLTLMMGGIFYGMFLLGVLNGIIS
ncbi:MAG: sodium:calcium antiporter [Syntrophomonadaceae bacterium]|jgi:cation:H+ antiporter